MTGSPEQAGRAAQQAIAAYKAAARDQLISIAQTVAFALASLDNLRLSAAPDLSLSMKLKLRGNANALHRSTQRSAAVLERQRHENHAELTIASPRPRPRRARTGPSGLAAHQIHRAHAHTAIGRRLQAHLRQSCARTAVGRQPQYTSAKATPAAPSEDDRKRTWANAMTDVAAECARALAKLPLAQRRAETIRISALSDIARHLASGGATPSKSTLLNTTALGACA